MAVVENFVLDALAILLDWLSVAIVLCIIYMLFALATGGKGIGNLFGGGDDDDSRGNRPSRTKSGGGDTPDGGKNNGPKDTQNEYGDWADGFGTVTVLVTDLDDKRIQGAKVVLKHRKIPKMSKKSGGNTGTNGTYGPMRVPAGPIMVKAFHRNYFQLGIWTAGGVLLGGALGFIGWTKALFGALGAKQFWGDRYYMKDWFILEKDKKEVFHIRLKQRKGQPDHAYEPYIIKVVEKEKQADGSTRGRLVGRID